MGVRPLRDALELPELRGSRFAEAIEGTGADEVQHLARSRTSACVEIADARERRMFALF